MARGDTDAQVAATMGSGAILAAVDACLAVVGTSGTIIITPINDSSAVIVGINRDD